MAGEDGGEGKGRFRGGLPASSAGNLFFLLPPCFNPNSMQFLLLYPTVEHQSGGIAPSSQAPCTTQPCCEHWVTSGSCCFPSGCPSPPQGLRLRQVPL